MMHQKTAVHYALCACLSALIGSSYSAAQETEHPNSLAGPEQVENRLHIDSNAVSGLISSDWMQGYNNWKGRLKDRSGLTIGGDYSTVYLSASESLGADTAFGGMYRLFGSWELTGDDHGNSGALVFKAEHRHAYGSELPPGSLGFETGYVGLHEPPFSDEGTRLTNFYWRQRFADGDWTFVGGFVDTTDYMDVYTLASPWTGFFNFAFSTGSASIAVPVEGLGFALGGYVTDSLYVIGGLADTNSDTSRPGDTFESFFDEAEYFKHFEIGWNPRRETAFLDNFHITVWQADERVEAATPDGWGINFSYSASPMDNQLTTFVRGGYAEDGGSLLERTLSTGFAWQTVPGGNQLGVAYNYGVPMESTWGPNLDDQHTVEMFYRVQLFRELAITPDLQYIRNPALNPQVDDMWVFGLRARFSL